MIIKCHLLYLLSAKLNDASFLDAVSVWLKSVGSIDCCCRAVLLKSSWTSNEISPAPKVDTKFLWLAKVVLWLGKAMEVLLMTAAATLRQAEFTAKRRRSSILVAAFMVINSSWKQFREKWDFTFTWPDKWFCFDKKKSIKRWLPEKTKKNNVTEIAKVIHLHCLLNQNYGSRKW